TGTNDVKLISDNQVSTFLSCSFFNADIAGTPWADIRYPSDGISYEVYARLLSFTPRDCRRVPTSSRRIDRGVFSYKWGHEQATQTNQIRRNGTASTCGHWSGYRIGDWQTLRGIGILC